MSRGWQAGLWGRWVGWDVLFCTGHGAFSAWGLQGVSSLPPKSQGSCAGGNGTPPLWCCALQHCWLQGIPHLSSTIWGSPAFMGLLELELLGKRGLWGCWEGQADGT